jgi:hypothetical protein
LKCSVSSVFDAIVQPDRVGPWLALIPATLLSSAVSFDTIARYFGIVLTADTASRRPTGRFSLHTRWFYKEFPYKVCPEYTDHFTKTGSGQTKFS